MEYSASVSQSLQEICTDSVMSCGPVPAKPAISHVSITLFVICCTTRQYIKWRSFRLKVLIYHYLFSATAGLLHVTVKGEFCKTFQLNLGQPAIHVVQYGSASLGESTHPPESDRHDMLSTFLLYLEMSLYSNGDNQCM